MYPVIDAHIHIDRYGKMEREKILSELTRYDVTALVAVGMSLESARQIKELARKYHQIKPVYGYHPEQALPTEEEVADLCSFIYSEKETLVGIGEVGLPYYLAQDDPTLEKARYIELLETFIELAKRLDKPLNLHAIYDDAEIVCQLLEKHSIKHAHFHWFKGDEKVLERIVKNGYYLSVTPDVIYRKRTQDLVKAVPIEQLMVETDGPWKFAGPFKGKETHPNMLHQSVATIASCKTLSIEETYEKLYETTKRFYRLEGLDG